MTISTMFSVGDKAWTFGDRDDDPPREVTIGIVRVEWDGSKQTEEYLCRETGLYPVGVLYTYDKDIFATEKECAEAIEEEIEMEAM